MGPPNSHKSKKGCFWNTYNYSGLGPILHKKSHSIIAKSSVGPQIQQIQLWVTFFKNKIKVSSTPKTHKSLIFLKLHLQWFGSPFTQKESF